MIHIYTEIEQGQRWLERYRGRKPIFACVLGFTATGLIPGISAAGATPHDRQFTCLADADEISVPARHPLLGAAKDIGATVGGRYTKILHRLNK